MSRVKFSPWTHCGHSGFKILEHFGMGNFYKELSEAFQILMGTVMGRMLRCRGQLKLTLEG